MLRLGVGVLSNIMLMALIPKLAMEGTPAVWVRFRLLAGAVSTIGAISLCPVLRQRDFAFRLAAIMLGLLPAFVLVYTFLDALFRFLR